MDGRRQRVLLAQGLGWPTALALDLPTSRLFWLDEKLGSVGSTHLDGTDVKVCNWRFWLWFQLIWLDWVLALILTASSPGAAAEMGPEPFCSGCV